MDATLDGMRRNPAGSWTLRDVTGLCGRMGIRCMPPSGGGSHYKISDPTQREILTIPHARPIKPVYIRKLVRFIDAVGEARAQP